MKTKLSIIAVFLLLFISSLTSVNAIPQDDLPSTEPGEYAITQDGKYAYINTDKAFIMAPAEIHGSGWTYLNFTAKQYTGDIDLALGFDTTHLKPKKAEFYNPHIIEWTTYHEQTYYNVIVYNNYSGEHLDCGNEYNTYQRIVEHDIITPENETIRVISNISFDTFDNTDLPDSAIIYWYTNHSRIEDWVDITDRFSVLPESIHNNYDGKNKWYYVKDQSITADIEYQIRIDVDAPPQLGEHQYKYDVMIKPSGQDFAQAISNENLFVLDPYWNTTFSSRIPITITTDGTSTPAGYQVLLNISYESEMQTDFDDIRFTNSSNGEIAYWIESKVDSSYADVWVNLSDAITDPGSDTIWMYYGNSELSNGSDGFNTFEFFDDFEDGDSTGWTTISGTWAVETDGTYVYSGSGSGTSLSFAGDAISNSNISTKMKIISGTGPVGVLVGRYVDATNYYSAQVKSGSTNNIQIWKQVGGSWAQVGSSGSAQIGIDTWYTVNFVLVGTSLKVYIDDILKIDTTDSSLSSGKAAFRTYDAQVHFDDVYVRKYIANEPTPSYGTTQYYTDSILYNSTNAYNITIESDSTLTSNRSIIVADDTNDTAQSTGTSYLIINVFDNEATIARNFTFIGDNLDWYQVANITGSYDLKNSSGIIETQTNGNFTTNLIAGTYWVEKEAPKITLLSQTPTVIYLNSTGYINISYGITHSASGINNTSVSFIYRNYDPITGCSNHSIMVPDNDKAAEWSLDGRIIRAQNRNETLNFEENTSITGGDIYTWSGLDENTTRLSIVPVNSTYTLVYINATIHDIMPQMWYLDRTDMEEAPKTLMGIHKTQNLLIKLWNLELFKGNYDHITVGYTDTDLDDNPALWPLDADPLNYYYVNDSYDPATDGDPLTSGYAFYMGSGNASEWVDHVYSPHTNSSYVRSFINNTILNQYINTTEISYLYLTSNTPSSKPYYINVTNVASSTNVSFADTNVLWAGDNTLSQQSYTPNTWLSFMKVGITFDHMLYVADNNDLWDNSTLNSTTILQGEFPPTTPTINHFHWPASSDWDSDMNKTYDGVFDIGVGISTDPDGGIVSHNLTLHYGNRTYIAIINNTFTNLDIIHNGVFADIEFNSTPYYSLTNNYTLRLISTDDEGEFVTTWLGVNFTLDGTPKIYEYLPETTVTSLIWNTQAFSITTSLPGNTTWYIDGIEVFNETSVNTSTYSNNTAPIGTYNVTVISTNSCGSNSITWDWTVTDHTLVPINIFIVMGILLFVLVGTSFYFTGISAIFTSILSMMFAFIMSKIAVNGTLIENIGGIDSAGNVIQGFTTIEYPALSYILIFIGLFMVVILAIQVLREIKFRESQNKIELEL